MLMPMSADGALGIAEGIETSLAGGKIFDVPVWAGISAAGMINFILPPGLKRLLIFADKGDGGEKAAADLCRRALAAGVERDPVAFLNLPPLELRGYVISTGIHLARRDVIPGSSALEAHDMGQVAIDRGKEDLVECPQATQARASIPERSRSTTGSAAAARSYSRLLSTHAVTNSSIAPKRQAAAILSEMSPRMLPRC